VLVGNLQLQQHPDLDHVKTWQTFNALKEMNTFVSKIQGSLKIYKYNCASLPKILAGDFASLPTSSVTALLN